VRRRFCDTVARSGIAENYEALTGEGLRERGFTWTSSIFLYLAHELGEGR
jgi:putative isomerase